MAGKEMQTTISISGVMSPSLRKAVSDVKKQLESVDKKALETVQKLGSSISTAVKDAAKATAGIATAAGVAFGGALIKGGNEYIRVMNGVSAQTGETGKSLEEMGQIAQDVYKSGAGEGFQDIADTLVLIKQQSKLAGEELQEAAQASLLLKDTFGMDTEATTQAAVSLMKNFGIGAEEAYGLIAKGAQDGANRNGDMLDILNEYAVHYKTLGLSADQFMQSLIAGAEDGAGKIDFIGDAMKEFTIRSKDGSDTTTDAFKALGLNAKNMAAQLANGGRVGEAAFFQTVKALEAIKDPVKKNELAVALFGTKFEDLESGILPVLGSMQGASLDAVGTLKEIEKIKYKDAGYALSQVGRTIQTSLIPAAEGAGMALYDAMPQIKASIDSAMPAITELGKSFAAALPGIIDGVMNAAKQAAEFARTIADNWNWIGPVVYAAAAAFAAIKLGGLIMQVTQTVKALWAFKGVFMQGLQAVKLLGTGMKFFTGPVGIAIGIIGALVAAGVWLYQNWDLVKEKAAQLGEYISGVWTRLKDSFSAFGDFVKNMFTTAFEAIPGIIKAPINWVIGKINGLLQKINSIGSIDIPGIGSLGINIPEIPMLAAGGFTKGVSIAGEAGTEAVISFDPAYRTENIGYLQKAASMLGVDTGNGLGYYADKVASISASGGLMAGNTTNTTYNLGGITFAPVVTVSGDSSRRDNVVEQLRNYQGDLLELIEELLATREAGNYGTAGAF